MDQWLQLGRDSVSALNHPKFDILNGFVESKETFNLTYEDQKIDDLKTGSETGIGISAIHDQNTHFFSFTSPEQCRDELPNIRHLLDVDTESTHGIDWQSHDSRSMGFENILTGSPDDEKVERVEASDSIARQVDDRISQVRVNYSEKKREIGVIDSNGWIHSETQQYLNFNILAIAQENGRREKGYGRHAGCNGEELFDQKSVESLATEAAEQAITALDAEPVSPEPRTVVIAPGFGGTIFHEACGHGFEADHLYEDVSQYSGRMGESVASECITFVDEGSRENFYGSYCFDDEGIPSDRNVLIKDGVMHGVMSDRKYANLLDRSPSGNGRRQSFRHPVLPRMTNTYIEAGDTNPDDIIADTESGIYAAHIGGGQVDPASGDFIFSVTEGYRIENGEITAPIRDAALVGNGPDVLNRVDAVGNDLEFQPGVCGKGQWVPVTVGQPTLRVQDLTVGGDG